MQGHDSDPFSRSIHTQTIPGTLGSTPEHIVSIPISSKVSTVGRSKSSPLGVLSLVRDRSPSSHDGARSLFPFCIDRISPTRRSVVISESDQPSFTLAAFLRESINRETMIGRKTSFPTPGRISIMGWRKVIRRTMNQPRWILTLAKIRVSKKATWDEKMKKK